MILSSFSAFSEKLRLNASLLNYSVFNLIIGPTILMFNPP